MKDGVFLRSFLDPQKSLPAMHELRAFWQENQMMELEAIIYLLLQNSDGSLHEFAVDISQALVEMPDRQKNWLVTMPSVVSWQQYATILAAQNNDAQSYLAEVGFDLDHLRHYIIAAAIKAGQSTSLTFTVKPDQTIHLIGTGISLGVSTTLRIGWDGVHLTFENLLDNSRSLSGELANLPKRWFEPADATDLWTMWRNPSIEDLIEVESRDIYLIQPFGERCEFLSISSDEAQTLFGLLESAFKLLDEIWPEMKAELLTTDRQILWVTNPDDPDDINSFSDNSVPGALYFSMRQSHGPLSVEDILDSLVHEHLHQKLYLLESNSPLYDPMRGQTFHSPWRTDPRPIGGVFHGYFVFYGLRGLWQRGMDYRQTRSYAVKRVRQITEQLNVARQILSENAIFTPTGQTLFEIMREFLL